jgi:uncharacterized repeat protein (TIGR03803 family)
MYGRIASHIMTIVFVLTLVPCGFAALQNYSYKVIYNFCSGNPNDGILPSAGLITDGNGNLYGTTPYGGIDCFHGAYAAGIVFQLAPNADGSWTENILHTFGSEDGAIPYPPVVLDAHGNLYGMTTATQGPLPNGSVYKLSQVSSGTWRLSTLHAFSGGADGGFQTSYPSGALAFSNAGQLLGNTSGGGASGRGVVFDLRPATPFYWYELVVHPFAGGADGRVPQGALTFDAAGNLYGTTALGGGNNDAGTVFKLTPNRGSFGWTETVLYSFQGSSNNGDGYFPDSGVILDSGGNLFGTTTFGGSGDVGTVFELTPSAGGTWTESVVYSFSGPDGTYPHGLTQDSSGNIYGTAEGGGPYGNGTVFELTRSGQQWTLQTLYAFTGRLDGGLPTGTLLLDGAGNIFGTASEGGSGGPEHGGVVFELSPASRPSSGGRSAD